MKKAMKIIINWPQKWKAFVSLSQEASNIFRDFPQGMIDFGMGMKSINRSRSLMYIIAAGDIINILTAGARMLIWTIGKNTRDSKPAIERFCTEVLTTGSAMIERS